MTVKVYIKLELTQAFSGKDVEMIVPEGTPVSGLLAGMIEIWGDSLSPHLFKPGTDQLLPYVRLMINGQNIQFFNGYGDCSQRWRRSSLASSCGRGVNVLSDIWCFFA